MAKEHHFTVEELERYEEKSTGSFLYTVFLMSQSQNADADMVTGEGRLFLEEQKQIQEMAVGRAGSVPGTLRCRGPER